MNEKLAGIIALLDSLLLDIEKDFNKGDYVHGLTYGDRLNMIIKDLHKLEMCELVYVVNYSGRSNNRLLMEQIHSTVVSLRDSLVIAQSPEKTTNKTPPAEKDTIQGPPDKPQQKLRFKSNLGGLGTAAAVVGLISFGVLVGRYLPRNNDAGIEQTVSDSTNNDSLVGSIRTSETITADQLAVILDTTWVKAGQPLSILDGQVLIQIKKVDGWNLRIVLEIYLPGEAPIVWDMKKGQGRRSFFYGHDEFFVDLLEISEADRALIQVVRRTVEKE